MVLSRRGREFLPVRPGSAAHDDGPPAVPLCTMEPLRRRLASMTAVLAVVAFVIAVVLAVISVRGGSHVSEWTIAGFTPGYVAGAFLLAQHRPDLPFGWVYLVAALLSAGGGVGAAYCGAALAQHWPGAAWGIWFTAWGSRWRASWRR